MLSWLRRLLPRSERARPGSTIELKPISPVRRPDCSRWLSTALDRALRRGEWSRAERIVQSTGHLKRAWPRIAEQVARYHIALGETDAALQAIEEAIVQTASLRLLRSACLLMLGRVDEARADLSCWTKNSTAPLGARTMLALLEAGRDDASRAESLLKKNIRQLDDPESLAALVVICSEAGDGRKAVRWASRLHASLMARDDTEAFAKLLDSLGHPWPEAAPGLCDEHARSLSLELLGNEEAIPVLVAAQEIEHDPRTAYLLAVAIEHTLPDLERPQLGYEALARLALASGDLMTADRWATAGVESCPLSAAIGRLRRDIRQRLRSNQAPQEQKAPASHDVIGRIHPDTDAPQREAAA